jgi:hypothetical protein
MPNSRLTLLYKCLQQDTLRLQAFNRLVDYTYLVFSATDSERDKPEAIQS